MYSAIDMALDKLEKQIKKSKQKIRDRRGGSRVKEKGTMTDVAAQGPEEAPGEITIKSIEYKPMDIEEAIMQMDLVNENFLVFTNARTDKVNVLYRRKAGNYGLIQPLG
jgi:putative sigma-54 modulation protein